MYNSKFIKNKNETPGFHLITRKVLQELPPNFLKLIIFIFNAILRINYLLSNHHENSPNMGKNLEEVKYSTGLLAYCQSYPKFSRSMQAKTMIDIREIIPDCQCGFPNKHGNIEQIHRLVNKINKNLNVEILLSGILDISQTFDKVWHDGLQYKRKRYLPHPHFQFLKSYFLIKQGQGYTDLHTIQSGIPQSNILGPTLYIHYTSDLPTRLTTIITFADIYPISASRNGTYKSTSTRSKDGLRNGE